MSNRFKNFTELTHDNIKTILGSNDEHITKKIKLIEAIEHEIVDIEIPIEKLIEYYISSLDKDAITKMVDKINTVFIEKVPLSREEMIEGLHNYNIKIIDLKKKIKEIEKNKTAAKEA